MVNIIYTRTLEQDDIDPRGNVMASGDPKLDKAAEEWVFAQLDAGNVAAWAWARVEASIELEGETFTGCASLGACSYDTESELWTQVGPDLDQEARADLERALMRAVKRSEVAAKLLEVLTIG